LLVGSVVIDVKFGVEDYISIPRNYDQGLKPLDAKNNPKPNSTGRESQKKVIIPTFLSRIFLKKNTKITKHKIEVFCFGFFCQLLLVLCSTLCVFLISLFH
jgi:hypothetical protein